MASFGPGLKASDDTSGGNIAVGYIGNATALALYFSSAHRFYGIWRRGSSEGRSSLGYVALASLLNCAVWVMYALPFVHPLATTTMVLSVNCIGLAVNLIYVGIFYYFATPARRCCVLKLLCVGGGIVASVAAVVFAAIAKPEKRSLPLGILGVICACVMYSMPLKQCKRVCDTGRVEHLSLLLSLVSGLNTAIWVAYGALNHDIFVLVPNVVGITLVLIQLVVYACYCNRNPDPNPAVA